MHESESNSTMPSGRRYIAVVGQIGTQGGFAQWLHRVTWKKRRVFGKVPFSTYLTQVRWTPRGTEFSALHAVVQAWQPMHRRLSMTNAKFMDCRLPSRRILSRALLFDLDGEPRREAQAQVDEA